MASFSLAQRILSFSTPLGANVLLPEHLSGSEGISELFCYRLDLFAAVSHKIEAKDIVGKRVAIGIQAEASGTERHIHGMVSSFEMLNGDQELNSYRATIVPTMWMLTLTKNTRCYQNKTVTEVIKDVLSTYSISPKINTSNTYTPLEYCVQYRESDFAFISRLMEQHGIFYYFEHTQDDHTLVLQDTSNKLGDNPIQDTFKFRAEQGNQEGFYDFVVREISARSTMVTGKFNAWDYSFKRYQTVMGSEKDTAGPLGANSNEDYDYSVATGFKVDESDTNLKPSMDMYTTVLRDASDSETATLDGVSNAICMQTGYAFTLTEHPIKSVNTKYLLVHAEHNVQQLPSYRARTREAPQPFSNTFRAVPFSTFYRSPQITEKPLVYGMHTGKVVVPSGEESHLDKYGRVNVQFWWDRLRQPNTPNNTWLRVAQSWASKGWGTYYWPRVDDEVLVGFMEGDPDQPIVVGSVYNGANMPPYDPVGQYTLSGIMTRSSKGGGHANANELRFEDLKGKEQIFMNAEKDYDLHVEDSWHTLIGAEQHVDVGKKQFERVGDEAHIHFKNKHYELLDDESHLHVKGKHMAKFDADASNNIGGNLKESVGSDANLKVGQNLNEKVGMNHSLNVGMNLYEKVGMAYALEAGMTAYIKGGMDVVIEGGVGITLKVGGNFVSITPAGVAIMGTLVMINSGGAPLAGSPPQPTDPAPPDAPTDPKDPGFPGDNPPSQSSSGAAGSAGAASKVTDTASGGGAGAAGAAGAAAGGAAAAAGAAEQAGEQAVQQATNEAAQLAQQAANTAQTAANQAEAFAKQAEQAAQQAVNQVMQQARQTYNQAQSAVTNAANQLQQQAGALAGQAQQAAQQALSQAQQQAQKAAQAAAQAVQQAQQQAQQVANQAQQAAQQAQQQAQQAVQQAQQAAQGAEQQAQAAVQQAQQQGQQAVQQGQQAVQQAQQQAQQAAKQAQVAAQQAQQQAQQAQQQVTQAASGAQQQAQQAAQAAQQSAQQALSSLPKGF